MTTPADALTRCLAAWDRGEAAERGDEKAAVKWLAHLMVQRAPGNSVEVRVPPYAAVQVVEGIRHRRGTPPATVECDARTFVELAVGIRSWQAATAAGDLIASGERSDLSGLLPLLEMPPV